MKDSLSILIVTLCVLCGYVSAKTPSVGGWDTPKKETPKETPKEAPVWTESEELKAATEKFHKGLGKNTLELKKAKSDLQALVDKTLKEGKDALVKALEAESKNLLRQRKISEAEKCTVFVSKHKTGRADWKNIPSAAVKRKYDLLVKKIGYLLKNGERKIGYKQKAVDNFIKRGQKPVLVAFDKEIDKAVKANDLKAAKVIETKKNEFKELIASHASLSLEVKLAKTGIVFRLIPAGSFTMGSPAAEAGRADDEGPQHKVTLTKAYYMGKYEITQGQWYAVMGTIPWKGKTYVKEGYDYAAAYISWDGAQEFCKKLSKQLGQTVTLPTEAQWEYACRAGTTTKYHFGTSDTNLGRYAWYTKNTYDIGEKYAHRVGQKLPNAFGLYDMHGNVWEWCSDWHKDSYPTAAQADPIGPATGSYRVSRGGCWRDSAGTVRSANRYKVTPSRTGYYLGFRVCLSPSPR